MFSVEYYVKQDGSCPVEEFILSLDDKMQAKIFRSLELLEEFGNQLREPHSKQLIDGIYELRVKQSSNITRVLYFFYINKKIILTNGFIKKTQNTPERQIDIAKKRRFEYLKREGRK